MYIAMSPSAPRCWTVVAATALLVLASCPALAEWAIKPSDVPVERLLENTREVLRKQPTDPQGYYVLGRLHSMAFALGKEELRVATAPSPRERALPTFLPYESVVAKRTGGDPKVLSTAQLRHLEGSISNYRRAVELWTSPPKEKPKSTDLPKEETKEKPKADDPAVARALLGLAWMLEEASTLRDAFAKGVASEEFAKLRRDEREPIEKLYAQSKDWETESLDAYRRIIQLMADKDKRRGFDGPEADSLMSREAAQAIVRILGRRKLNRDEQEELKRAEAHVAALTKIGRAVTPLIFPADGPKRLEELLARENHVDFDLAADGLGAKWPWLRPDACILVWDPKRTGQVRDGRQLFGSVTWWIFWDHGYQPLAALDDDRDGWLTGRELDGLAAWQDRNGNGKSDRGEVAPVADRGIRRIAARAEGRQDGVLMNARGIQLQSGTWLPTYDWTPTSVPAKR